MTKEDRAKHSPDVVDDHDSRDPASRKSMHRLQEVRISVLRAMGKKHHAGDRQYEISEQLAMITDRLKNCGHCRSVVPFPCF